MRILCAPMAVPLPANGPYSQFLALAKAASERGHEFAAAAARDAAWRDPKGIHNYPVPTPRLLGWIPRWAVEFMVRPLLLKGEAGARRTAMRSFEQVQSALGLASLGYFFADMEAMRRAIRDYRPDLVVAGRYSALLAAAEAGAPTAAIMDRTQSSGFAASPGLTARLRRRIESLGLGRFESLLDIAYRADLLIVPNLREFADLGSEKAVYVGPLGARRPTREAAASRARDTILCYAGTSGIAPRRLAEALSRHERTVGMRIIVAWGGGEERIGRALLVSRFDPREELGRARLMIHHGGQNSCYDCLSEGIAQLAIPGRHFERYSNARAIVEAGAGLIWDPADGEGALGSAVERLLAEGSFAHRARALGERLAAAGGWDGAFEAIEGIAGHRE